MLDVFGSIQAALREPLGAFLLGLIVGSYLNVVALRWGERNDVKGGRSRCSHCQRPLRWWELIPLVSYVLLRGQCARCGHRLSPRYPLVELGTAVTFTLLAGASDDLVQFVALIVVASLLIVLALIDLDQGILPDQLTLGGSTVVVLYLVATGNSSLLTPHPASPAGGSSLGFDHWLWGIVVGVGALGFLVLITRGKGMGLGDVKLGALIGVSLGGVLALLALWAAFLLGAVVGTGLVLAKRARWRGTELSFGPFLALGWLVAVCWGEPILAWYTGL